MNNREKVIEKYAHDYGFYDMSDETMKEMLEKFLKEILIADSPQGPEDVEPKEEKKKTTLYRKVWNPVTKSYYYLGLKEKSLKEKKIEEIGESMTKKQQKYLINFSTNLQEGIGFYYALFKDLKEVFINSKSVILGELEASSNVLGLLRVRIESLKLEVSIPN